MARPDIDYAAVLDHLEGRLEGGQIEAFVARIAADRTLAQLVSVVEMVRESVRQPVFNPPADLTARLQSIHRSPTARSTPRWLDAVDRVVAQLIFDSRSETAGVRYAGTGDRFQATWAADETEVDLQGEREGDGWRLMGQLAAERPLPPGGSRVRIEPAAAPGDAEAPIGAVELETRDDGFFECSLPAGRWTLLIETVSVVLTIGDVDLPAS
ncbi:MAG: hypothetical protein AB8G96_16330 [Phycisphaerales bacterium]